MDLMNSAIARQAKWEQRPFQGTAMQWLAGAMNPAVSSNFPFLRIRWKELLLSKQAAITLAAMRFAIRDGDRYFGGAERIADICDVSERTVRAHWQILQDARLIRLVASKKNSYEFVLVSDSPQDFYMLPIAFDGLDTFAERILCAMVLSNAAKVMKEETDDWSYQVVCSGRSAYLNVAAQEWTKVTGLSARHLYRARTSLEEKDIISVHGYSRRFILPFGDHREWDQVRPHLDLAQ